MRLKYDCRRFVHFQIIVVIFGLIVMMATISRRYPSYARPEPHVNSNNVVEPESILTKPEPCASKPDQYYGGPDHQHNESRPDHPGGISDCTSSDQTYPPEYYPVDQPGDSEYNKPYPDGPLLVFARGVEDPLATGGVVGERLSHTPRRASSGERIPAAPPGLSTSFRPLHDTNARNTQHTTTT